MHASVLMLVLAAAAARPTVEEATQAYRAGRYAEACRVFQRAVDEAPADGDRWSDLGLCLGKLGRKAEAVAAEIRAAELGGQETRLHAYFNLGALGVRVSLPEVPEAEIFGAEVLETACTQVRSSGVCRDALTVCPYNDGSGTGTGYVSQRVGWLFCPPGVPMKGIFGSDERAPAQRKCFTLELRSLELDRCRHYCESTDAECSKGEEECRRNSKPEVWARDCQVVFVDACHHRAGALCTGEGKRRAIEAAPENMEP